MTSDFIGPAEAAKRARVSRPTVSRALKSGDLPGIRDNSGQWKISFADVDAWAARRSPVQPERRAHTDDSDLPAQLEQAKIALAAAEARAEGLAARLTDAQTDRDAWKAQAERLASEPRPVIAPVTIWDRIERILRKR